MKIKKTFTIIQCDNCKDILDSKYYDSFGTWDLCHNCFKEFARKKYNVCLDCHGTGVRRGFQSKSPCPTCEGKGFIKRVNKELGGAEDNVKKYNRTLSRNKYD